MSKKAPKTASKPKATPKPLKPAKGVYVAPSPEEWRNKPTLAKIKAEFGKHAGDIHKLQFELRAVKAKLKKYKDAAAWVCTYMGAAGVDESAAICAKFESIEEEK